MNNSPENKTLVSVSIKEAREILVWVAIEHGCPVHSASFVVDHYLRAEASGKRTHGVRKFLKELKLFPDRQGSPKIVLDTGAFVRVDANREIGPIAADYATRLARRRANVLGGAIVGMSNMQRYGVLGQFARDLADGGLIGIVMNTSEPALVAPNSLSPVLGSNPFAYAFPTTSEPVVFDMSSTKVSMSTILNCLATGTDLPEETFRDKNGQHTRIASEARGADNSGGYKGFGSALLIEIMAGAYIGAHMGRQINPPYGVGALFIALSPSVFGSREQFESASTSLLGELRSASNGLLKLPGERSSQRLADSNGYLQLPHDLAEALRDLNMKQPPRSTDGDLMEGMSL